MIQPDYHNLTDDELLHIAEDRNNLTDEARLALDTALNSRKLSRADIDTYQVGREQAEKADQLRRARTTHSFIHGVTKEFFGKANRRRDPSGAFEEYDSTLWFAVVWFPLFPIGTFTVRCNIERWLGFEWKGSPVALERHPHNWEQILLTWVKAVVILWVIVLTFRFFVHHPEWFHRLP